MPNTPFPDGWDLEESPFHPGEWAIQERVGVRERIEVQGRRSVRRAMTEQHRAFFAMLPYAFIGSVDHAGQPWASMLVGPPGFIRVPDAHTAKVSARPLPGDPLNGTLRAGAELSLLGVQLPTRRRNRLTGTVTAFGDGGFTLGVRQTMGLCHQYIQGREMAFTADPARPKPGAVHRAPVLDSAARAIVEGADTFFVASADLRPEHGEAGGVDISHRGGRPGFVRVDDAATITTPDFVGNYMFNTLGNFSVNDRAGLLFVDFTAGTTLHLAARAEVIWDGPELAAFAGAKRLVRFRVTEAVRVENALPVRFSAPDFSPVLARTGTWREAAERLRARE